MYLGNPFQLRKQIPENKHWILGLRDYVLNTFFEITEK